MIPIFSYLFPKNTQFQCMESFFLGNKQAISRSSCGIFLCDLRKLVVIVGDDASIPADQIKNAQAGFVVKFTFCGFTR